MINTSSQVDLRPDFESMTAVEVEAYEAETDRVIAECSEACRESRSLVGRARALRPMADRWVYLPSQGYKRFGDFTAEDREEIHAYWTSLSAQAEGQVALLEAELARRGAP